MHKVSGMTDIAPLCHVADISQIAADFPAAAAVFATHCNSMPPPGHLGQTPGMAYVLGGPTLTLSGQMWMRLLTWFGARLRCV